MRIPERESDRLEYARLKARLLAAVVEEAVTQVIDGESYEAEKALDAFILPFLATPAKLSVLRGTVQTCIDFLEGKGWRRDHVLSLCRWADKETATNL
jgi:hypothetical protein